MGGLSGISDLAGGLISKFEKWYEATGRSELLAAFFLLVEILGNAWDYVDKIYSTMRGAGANPLLAGLTALSAMPMALGLGIAKTAGKDPGELLGWIVDQDKNIVRWIVTTFPFFARIHEILKKVLSVFEWLYSLFQSFWSWIQRAMPGAEKEKARQKMVDQIAKEEKNPGMEGLHWVEQRGDHAAGWYNKNSALVTPSKKLNDLRTEYESLPGFAEGIAEAVKKGISSIGDTIAEKIKGAFPDLTELINSLTDLVNLLKGQGDIEKIATDTTPKIVTDAASLTLPGPMGAVVRSLENPVLKPVANWGFGAGQWVGNQFVGGEGHAAGATFTRGGLFAGKVHSPEEIIPQAIASKGAGPISRALGVLDSVMSGQPSSMGAGAGAIHIHMPTQDFSGMKISSDVDFKRLLIEANKKTFDGVMKEVKKIVGPGRT